jgi:hypothetical protein
MDAKTREEVEAFRDHPALLAWYANDELPLSYMEQLTRKYRLVRAADPNHPVWVVLYQVDDIPSYMPTTDVIGTDPYPVPAQPLSMAGDWARKTVAGTGGAGAVWMVPQAHDWSVYRKPEERQATDRAPTLGDVRNMSLQCLAEGAMGLVYYSYFDLKRDPKGFDVRWADMKQVVSEVRLLVPYVLSTDPAPDIGLRVTGSGAHARAWRLGNEVAVVAANGSARGLATVHWRLRRGAKPELLFGDAVTVTPTGVTLGPGQSAAVRVTGAR